MKDVFGGITSIFFCIYFIIAEIMAVVFFIQYCKTDSLGEIIFIDSFLSELKGLLWVIFIW